MNDKVTSLSKDLIILTSPVLEFTMKLLEPIMPNVTAPPNINHEDSIDFTTKLFIINKDFTFGVEAFKIVHDCI